MKSEHIGILAIQEAHLDQQYVDRLHHLFGKCLNIHFSAAAHTTNAQGVAIILNKEITNVLNVTATTIIPGRALFLTIPWHGNLNLKILNIYAPNGASENEHFWSDLQSAWEEKHLPPPDILLGDFNIVEDSLDRLPCHPDNASAVSALTDLHLKFNLQDGWRMTFPDSKAFSFLQPSTGSQSRIDRIYTSPHIITSAVDWQIFATAIPMDHHLVSLLRPRPVHTPSRHRVVNQTAPHIGKGRWTLPLFLLQDTKFAADVDYLGCKLEQDIHNCLPSRSQTQNPQTLFASFK
ncbi:Endonuclease/exonuclease/phosphatase [Sparassis latifolia]